MINWKVRVRQKWFWLTIIPAVLMLLDQLWVLFAVLGSIQAGHLYDGPLMEAMLSLVGTVFMVLVVLGIPVDTTTEGYGDSARALTYEAPAPNASAYGLQEYEEQCAAAAAMALGNLLGLVCDPVAGLVEVPCIKRNVVGAVNAVSCANMALAGVDYAIPCDEVIDAMGRVGSLLSPDLRETGQGGLAATPTGVRIAERLAEEA